jgi:hypothetical protein
MAAPERTPEEMSGLAFWWWLLRLGGGLVGTPALALPPFAPLAGKSSPLGHHLSLLPVAISPVATLGAKTSSPRTTPRDRQCGPSQLTNRYPSSKAQVFADILDRGRDRAEVNVLVYGNFESGVLT